MASEYAFVTVWKLEAPLEKVWAEIESASNWPAWWKGVVSVKEIESGDTDGLHSVRLFKFRSALPYKLSFHSRVTRVEKLKMIEGVAYGELDGKGRWTFSHTDNITTVKYEWKVKTTKRWMNWLAPIARPVFAWNHDVIMKWGGKGLAQKLNCRLIQ